MTTDFAFRRICHDITELKEEPIVGANAEPFGSEIEKWYGIVIGVAGTPYVGIPIRFTLEIPNNYPHQVPSVFFDTEVIYNDGAKYVDASGRHVVCLDILGNCGNVHAEPGYKSSGWNAAYTVKTILLSIQALMFDGLLSTVDTDIQLMKESARKFECSVTGHQGSDRSKWFPQVIMEQKAVDEIMHKHGRPKHDMETDFYTCSINKTNSKTHGIDVGYGIRVDNPKNGILSTPCEYLSRLSYNEMTCHATTQKFVDWIPILVHSKQWPNLKPYLLLSVNRIVKEISTVRNDADEFTKVFKVCSSIMNTLVVEVLNNQQNRAANDKLINGYFAFYRHLLQYAEITSFVNYVDNHLTKFLQDPNYRNKNCLPNLGEILILVTLAQKYEWPDIAQIFLDEWDKRNVSGYIAGNKQVQSQKLYPELASVNVPVTNRAGKVFAATELSRHLVMLQFKFTNGAKTLNVEEMDANLGLAPDELLEELREVYNQIIGVKSWDGFYDWLELSPVSVAERERQLVEAVKRSAAAGYHRPSVGTTSKN